MRRPSTFKQLYGWWADALAGREPPRHDGEIHCGYYRYRKVKGGPYLPVEVRVDRDLDPETGELANDEILVCDVCGEPIRHAVAAAIFTYAAPISSGEYHSMMACLPTDKRMSDPIKKINLMKEAVGPNG